MSAIRSWAWCAYTVTDHCECNQYMIATATFPADGITMSYVSPMRS